MASKKPLKLGLDLTKTSVADAQSALKPHVLGAGVVCPCCLQVVKLREVRITPSMAYVAILLHRHFLEDQAWLHVSKYLENLSKVCSAVRFGDWYRLRHWGILEQKPSKGKDKLKSKLYVMTERGHQFVKGEIKVQKTILIYNERFVGFGPGEVGVQECLGQEYDYADLMAGNLGGLIV